MSGKHVFSHALQCGNSTPINEVVMLQGHVPPFCDLIFSRLERFSCLEASSKRFPLHLVTLSKQTTHVGRAQV